MYGKPTNHGVGYVDFTFIQWGKDCLKYRRCYLLLHVYGAISQAMHRIERKCQQGICQLGAINQGLYGPGTLSAKGLSTQGPSSVHRDCFQQLDCIILLSQVECDFLLAV